MKERLERNLNSFVQSYYFYNDLIYEANRKTQYFFIIYPACGRILKNSAESGKRQCVNGEWNVLILGAQVGTWICLSCYVRKQREAKNIAVQNQTHLDTLFSAFHSNSRHCELSGESQGDCHPLPTRVMYQNQFILTGGIQTHSLRTRRCPSATARRQPVYFQCKISQIRLFSLR